LAVGDATALTIWNGQPAVVVAPSFLPCFHFTCIDYRPFNLGAKSAWQRAQDHGHTQQFKIAAMGTKPGVYRGS